MLRRLVYLLIGGTVLFAGITLVLRYFSDILPLASTEPQSIWRFETASLLTAAQLLALAVVAVTLVSIVKLLRKPARDNRANRS